MSGFSWSRFTVMNLDLFVHIPKWGKIRALPDHFGVSNALLTAPAVHKTISSFIALSVIRPLVRRYAASSISVRLFRMKSTAFCAWPAAMMTSFLSAASCFRQCSIYAT